VAARPNRHHRHQKIGVNTARVTVVTVVTVDRAHLLDAAEPPYNETRLRTRFSMVLPPFATTATLNTR
ncbi:MAG: hypothetical protein ACRD04_00650, partial [Terriglobales bacterium]